MVRALATLLCEFREKLPDTTPVPNTAAEATGPVVESVVKLYGSGTLDEQWVPQIRAGGWIVISTDRAKRCGGQKLPALLALHGVTHALVSGTLHQAG